MNKVINKDNKLPFYANYFHAVSLSEERNIFNTDEQADLGSVDVQFQANYETDDLIEEIDIHMIGDGNYDIIVISDYAKGMITQALMTHIQKLGKKFHPLSGTNKR